MMRWIKHFTEFILLGGTIVLSTILIMGLPILIIFAIFKVLKKNG